LATGYLAFRCLEGVATIALGGSVLATRSLVPNYEIMIYGFTGTAELRLSYLLYKAQLVPTWLSWLGIVGYIAIVAAIPTTLLNIAPLDSGVGICCTFRAASSSCSCRSCSSHVDSGAPTSRPRRSFPRVGWPPRSNTNAERTSRGSPVTAGLPRLRPAVSECARMQALFDDVLAQLDVSCQQPRLQPNLQPNGVAQGGTRRTTRHARDRKRAVSATIRHSVRHREDPARVP